MVFPPEVSSRATPRYYGEFRDSVIRGIVPVCQTISLEMQRIDDRIRNPDIYYDPRPVEAFIAFCEGELTKTDGTSVRLLDSFKLWAEEIFGWYYVATKMVYVENPSGHGGVFRRVHYLKRLISKLYLIVARGAAKTMFVAFLHAYFLIVDGETTHQVTTAPTMAQAEEVLSPIRTAILRSPGPLFKFLTIKAKSSFVAGTAAREMLASTKKGIESSITGSLLEIRPMSIAKLQGLRTKMSSLDEWLSGDIREDVVGALEQGAAKLEDYCIVAVSSEGTVRNAAGDNIKFELIKILNKEYDDPHTSIFYYRLDDVSEVANPDLWLKANPNLGLTVSYETYQRDVERATNVPATRNDILAKRFGLPMEGYTYFFTYDETVPHSRQNFDGMVCAWGADMSQGDDFCAFSFLFPLRGNKFGIKTLNFISERTFYSLYPAARIKYDEFIAEGSLLVMPGAVLDMSEVYDEVMNHVDAHNYILEAFGYDPYNASLFVKRYTEEYGSFAIVIVRQGVRTETVPLGELKKYAADRGLIFDQVIMEYAMGNTMVLEDNNGNRKLYKRRYEAKIDPVSSTMDAYVAYKIHRDLFE